jgi:hypothetical protein
MDISMSVIRPNWLPALFNTLTSEPFWVLGAMILSKRRDHFDRSHYHIHMNALYRVGNQCFSHFLERVRTEFVDTAPDLAMHLYRTDYVNFREAQHTQHLFRYSRLFLSLDVPVTVRPTVHPADWPGTYFLIQERNWAFQGANEVKNGLKIVEKEAPSNSPKEEEKAEVKEKAELPPVENVADEPNEQILVQNLPA